jgi:hypothetical protein
MKTCLGTASTKKPDRMAYPVQDGISCENAPGARPWKAGVYETTRVPLVDS